MPMTLPWCTCATTHRRVKLRISGRRIQTGRSAPREHRRGSSDVRHGPPTAERQHDGHDGTQLLIVLRRSVVFNLGGEPTTKILPAIDIRASLERVGNAEQ